MPESPDNTPLPLAYATIDTDGLPEFHPEADAMIAAGKPPDALRKIFRDGRLAARYFGKSFARQHAAETSEDVCCVCGKTPAGRLAMTQWRVIKRPRSFSLGNASEVVGTLKAFHPICTACEATWLRRTDGWRWIGVLVIIGFWAMLIFLPAAFGLDLERVSWTSRAYGFVLGILFLGGVVGRIVNWVKVKRVTPRPILRLARKNFRFLGFAGSGDRREILAANAPFAGES